MSEPLWRFSAVDLAAGIKNKTFSSVEVIESVATRIEAKNEGLNAIVYNYSEQAIEAAKAADDVLQWLAAKFGREALLEERLRDARSECPDG